MTLDEQIELVRSLGGKTRIKSYMNLSGDGIFLLPEELAAYTAAVEAKRDALKHEMNLNIIFITIGSILTTIIFFLTLGYMLFDTIY